MSRKGRNGNILGTDENKENGNFFDKNVYGVKGKQSTSFPSCLVIVM
jgi:hypothetical protein